MEHKTDSWQQKYNELLLEAKQWQKDKDELKKENDRLKNALSASTSPATKEHSGDFWQDIDDKCLSDPDAVKLLVKNKILSVHDTNSWNETLLHIATYYGSYEIVQFCINYGADINAKNYKGQISLDVAREKGYYHIEQLLLFSQMNVNVGNEIKNTANNIHKQNGINYNILNELSSIGQQTKELFEKILMELMINIITRRLSFSDNLLNLCWNIASEKNNPLSSDLWKAISSTCSDIIQNGSKRDWFWLKSCVIPSTIWFKNINVDKEEQKLHYLYYELLKLVDIQAHNELNKLEEDLNKLANENKNNWDKLTKWDMSDQYQTVRQDVIPNGIVSRYTYNQLSESSGATFNSPKFYDYNQYLSQLVLLAQIVNDEFQRSVAEMFEIDKVTNEGIVKFNTNMFIVDDEKRENDDDIGDGKIKYMRGPVKLIERARNKAQNDYANEEYPASACVLDLNRCALAFNDVSTLLAALEMFVNKVKYYQSGNIIGIVRDKNGFIEYVKETQYADIKLNVLIKGKHNNLIGEVQFLLNVMKEFKDKAHNLYSIQRQKESIESSVSKILPMLLDEDRQLFIAGNRGNVKGLCELMVINNKSITDIMKTDKDTGDTILHTICKGGHYKAFLFVKSIISKESFIKHVLTPNVTDHKPIENSIQCGRVLIAKCLFDIEEIKQHYKEKNELFRLCYWLFRNPNGDLIDYILNLLNITNDDVMEMMTYKYKTTGLEGSNAWRYDQETILSRLVLQHSLNHILKLVSVVGQEAFTENIFFDTDLRRNPFEQAVNKNKLKIIEYMLSFKETKNKYLNNDNLLFRLMYWLFARCGKQNIINYVLSELQISNDKMKQLIAYRCAAPSREFGNGASPYHYYSIIGRLAGFATLDALKVLVGLVGEKAFYDAVFMKDGWNRNALQYAIIKNRLEFVKYMMNVKEIREKCVDDNDELYDIISSINYNFDESVSIASYIVNILDLTEAKLSDLKAYRDIDITKILSIA